MRIIVKDGKDTTIATVEMSQETAREMLLSRHRRPAVDEAARRLAKDVIDRLDDAIKAAARGQ